MHVNISTVGRRLSLLAWFVLAVIISGCGSSPAATAVPTLAPAAAGTATPGPQPTFTPRPTPTPVPSPTKGPNYSMLVLRWTGGAHIADVDDVSDIVLRLQAFPGIIGGYGDEIQITVTYDPQKTNPALIQKALSDLGYQTAPP